jgi:REP element-mobilizing transposase RayT
MSRPWRIEYEGALYHLFSRGNEACDIFLDNTDRQSFLDTIAEMTQRFEIDVFAYVLMSDHYHLLVRTRRANLKKAMHWFGTTYTLRFNRRHFRSGHLFQGRYKSIIVQNDAYLLQLSYYIHRNPLRAGTVKRLADYNWSSYKVYAYGRKTPTWLITDMIISHFEGEQDRHKSYREKVQKYSREEKRPFEDFRHGLIVGSKQFAEKIRKKYLPSKLDAALPQQNQLAADFDLNKFLIKAESRLKCDIEHFAQANRLSGADKDKRDMLLYVIWNVGCLSNEQIGSLFGISYSAVSHIVRSFKTNLKKDEKMQTQFSQINSLFHREKIAQELEKTNPDFLMAQKF